MTASLAAAEILRRGPGRKPRVGIVLGSGLGAVASLVEQPNVVPYAALPGFPQPTVEGHPGRVTLGLLGGVEVAVMRGRHHAYEGEDAAGLRTFVRCFKQIGCEAVVLTGAAGSLRPDLPPGRLMAVTDHINMSGHNPLVGPNEAIVGPRFVSMANAYDPALRALMVDAAESLDLMLDSGVYAGSMGPCYETPAEARMFALLGADVVGMSIVPECVVARHCGLRVAGCVVVSSWGDGVGDGPIQGPSIQVAEGAAADMGRLLTAFLRLLNATEVRES